MRLFVGIDPGKTVGLALVDANAETKYVETFSRRDFAFSDILELLSEKGEPILVAADRKKAPLLARKVAAAFGARLFSQKSDMKQKEKQGLTKGYIAETDHERDALAAALAAKQAFTGMLEKVERHVEKEKQGIVKKLLITGRAGNIEAAVELLDARKKEGRGTARQREKDKFVARLVSEMEKVRLRNSSLEGEVARLRKELHEKRYQRSEGAAMKQLRESAAKALAEKGAIIRELRKLVDGEYVEAVVYDERMEESGMKNKAVIIDSADEKTVRRVEGAGAKAVITDENITSALPVLEKRKVNIMAVDKFLAVHAQEIKGREEKFEVWLENYRRRYEEEKT